MRIPRHLLSVAVFLFLASQAAGQTNVYTDFPQLAVGGGWSCDFFINNQGLTPVSGLQISFFDDNGAPLVVSSNLGNPSAIINFALQPGETKTIRVTLSGNATVAGYAVLRRPFPAPVIATMVVRFKAGSQVATQLGLPQQYPVEHYSFPVEINGSTNTNTGIAVANPTFGSSSAKAQTFVISLIAPDGTLEDLTTLTLPAGGHVSMMINDARLFPNLANYSGTGTISAGKKFGFEALRLEGGSLGTVAVEEGSVLPPAQVSGAPVQEIEPNNSRSQAQALTLPVLATGTISSGTDQDHFSFSAKAGDPVSVMAETVDMDSDLDSVVEILDSNGATIAENDQNMLFFQNDSFVHLVIPNDGTYYIRVTSWSEEGGPTFVYRLHVINRAAAPEPEGPTIQSISPSEGSPGSSFTLTITGTNLANTSAVTFSPSSGITVSNIQSSATQVTASLAISSGAATGARQVSVTTPGGTSNAVTFTVGQNQVPPSIQSISPSQGAPGSTVSVTISGSNLVGTTAVSFSPSSGITVSNIQSSATQVTASVSISSGASTGTRQVSVTTPAGTSNSVAFTVSQTQVPPSITSISPSEGSPGSSLTLTIAGSNLSGATAVSFSPSSGITVSNIQSSATQVTASVAISSSATTGARQVSVTTPAGTSNALTFTISQGQQLPHLDFLSPTQGSKGSSFTLTIYGTNLTGATGVSFSPSTGITVSNIQASSSQMVTASITISTTATASSRQVSVTTPAGTSNTLTFAVTGAAPTISSISPTLGTPGTSLTLTVYGTNLTGVSSVDFSPSTGITVSNIQVASDSRLTASVSIASGAGLGARQVSVTSPSGTSNTKTFNVSQAGSYDGTWTGTTGQGKNFSFVITGNTLVRIDYAGSLSGGGCSVDFSGWTTTSLPLGGTIIDFTLSNSAPSGIQLDVDGSFSDTSHASGTVKMTLNPPPPGAGGCSGWVTTSWSATKH